MASKRNAPQSNTTQRTEFRTRAGCSTCITRRKKCDEKKPICTGCARNFINCVWRERVPAKRQRNSVRASEKSSRNRLSQESGSDLLVAPGLTTSWAGIGRLANVSAKQSLPHSQQVQVPQRCSEDELKAIDGTNTDRQVCLNPWALSMCAAEGALLLTPRSPLLLQHYLQDTSKWLVPRPQALNPFISLVLPLAYTDDKLMHAILALSGFHLSSQKSCDFSIQSTTRKHYTLLLRSLRLAFADSSHQIDFKQTLHLLLTLLVLCHVEVSSDEVHRGIFPHLRAARLLVLQLLKAPQRNHDADTKMIMGLALETYSYLVLVNNITAYGLNETRTIPFDTFFTLNDILEGYDTFGVFLACGKGLFEHIPTISTFAMTRLNEEKAVVACTPESDATYKSILAALNAWKPPPISPELANFENEHGIAGKIYQHSLLLFLKTSMNGSVVDNPKVIMDIQCHVDLVFDMFSSILDSPFGTIMLWPLVMVGSCCISERQCQQILKFLKIEGPSEIFHVSQAATLLRTLWDHPDRRAYGPFGLHFIMQKHEINFSMA